MDFFDSEIVQNELEDIGRLQKKLVEDVFKYPQMTKEEKEGHVDVLSKLLEKQQLFYTRLCLSDDPEAKKMKERIFESSKALGFGTSDMSTVFRSMKMTIENLKSTIDK